LGSRPYKEQAIWFLNAYEKNIASDGENLWKWTNKFAELDKKGKEGSELDEVRLFTTNTCISSDM
jgi:hypothetical protein